MQTREIWGSIWQLSDVSGLWSIVRCRWSAVAFIEDAVSESVVQAETHN